MIEKEDTKPPGEGGAAESESSPHTISVVVILQCGSQSRRDPSEPLGVAGWQDDLECVGGKSSR